MALCRLHGRHCAGLGKHQCTCAFHLAREHGEWGHIVVPLDQRWRMTWPRHSSAEQVPHNFVGRPAVVVDQKPHPLAIAILGESGEMEFTDTLYWECVDIGGGIETAIDRRNVNIVDVEQKS